MGRHMQEPGPLAAVVLPGLAASPAAAVATFTEFRLTSAVPAKRSAKASMGLATGVAAGCDP